MQAVDAIALTAIMSPTIFRRDGFRFHFYSEEEDRMHAHVQRAEGEAKFWIEPVVGLAWSKGMSERDLRRAQRLVEENVDEIIATWRRIFPRTDR